MKNGALIVLLLVAGCAVEERAPADESDSANAGAGGGDPYEHGAGGEGPKRLANPELALTEIPSAMHPTALLDELGDQLLVPSVANGGQALFTDIVTIEAGEDVTYCTYLDVVTDEVLYLHDSLGVQTRGGHHAILQYFPTPQEPGTRACPDESDLSAQPGQILGGTGGEGTEAIVLPPNVVSEVPAGAQLVINHHWINTTDKAFEAQAEMVTVPPAAGQDLIVARGMAIVLTEFDLPPGQVTQASIDCAFPKGTQLLSMLGHQHAWGTHVRAERMAPSEMVIFDHDYTPEMVSQPLTSDFPLEDPFTFNAGDVVRMTCEWNNTTESPLGFPREMCVLFGWQIGAEADTRCVNGDWL